VALAIVLLLLAMSGSAQTQPFSVLFFNTIGAGSFGGVLEEFWSGEGTSTANKEKNGGQKKKKIE
jgi:hypothetical protein